MRAGWSRNGVDHDRRASSCVVWAIRSHGMAVKHARKDVSRYAIGQLRLAIVGQQASSAMSGDLVATVFDGMSNAVFWHPHPALSVSRPTVLRRNLEQVQMPKLLPSRDLESYCWWTIRRLLSRPVIQLRQHTQAQKNGCWISD